MAANYWPSFRTRALWWFTAFAEVAVFVQVCLGVGLVAGQHVKPPQFHLLYGFTAFITIGIIYAYRAQLRHRMYLLYGYGGLFIMGLGIRAILVGKT